MTVELHAHGWLQGDGRFYDVALRGRAIGVVGRWANERRWWWQHAKDSARTPRTGTTRTRHGAVQALVLNHHRAAAP
jgi:hypothetical protein